MSWRKKRLVRLHLQNDQPSIEGIFTGFWAGHYVLTTAKLIEAADRSYSFDGGPSVSVHKDRVLCMQELYQ